MVSASLAEQEASRALRAIEKISEAAANAGHMSGWLTPAVQAIHIHIQIPPTLLQTSKLLKRQLL